MRVQIRPCLDTEYIPKRTQFMTANQAHTFTINKLFVTESRWIVSSVFLTLNTYTQQMYTVLSLTPQKYQLIPI